jgi:hypothetical protein
MKEWLRRKLNSFLWPEDQPVAYDDRKMATLSSARTGRPHGNTLSNDNEPLRFTVYNASGGKIVEISHYDQRTDRHHTSLHIITSDEDFGESLGKIAFLEVLKKG